MAKPKITRREFLIARAFLKQLKGNGQNTYLILAVVAWMRAMNKAHDPFWKALKGYTPYAAGVRLANKLAARARSGTYKREYAAILRRLREQHTKGSAMASQAGDFILGIAKSHWDKKHYGLVEYQEGHWERIWHQTGWGSGYYEDKWVPPVEYKNPLWDAYAALTNKPGIPDSWWVTVTTTTKTKVIPPRPHQPRSLAHVLPAPDYIQPYEVARWYAAKPHYGDNVLLDE